MKACDVIQEDLPGYAAQRLSSVERARVDAHLRACPACPQELASLVRLERLLSLSLPVLATSPTLRSRFASRLAAELEAEEAEAAKRSGLFGWLTRPWLIPAVASAAVAVVVLLQSFGDSPVPTPIASAPAMPGVVARQPETARQTTVAKVEPAAPAELASANDPNGPGLGVPPEVEQDPELFVDFAIIEELDTLQTIDGTQESAG